MKESAIKIGLVILVAIHFVGNLWHGDAHETLEVGLPTYKWVYVYAVIAAAPILGAILLWTRFYLAGCWTIALSMLGSVLFSVYHHYVMVSDDNVHFLPPGSAEDHQHFSNSAELIAVVALAGALLAFYEIGKQRVASG